MTTPSTPTKTPERPALPVVITPQQQEVLDRIATQRARIKARQVQRHVQSLAQQAVREANVQTPIEYPPGAPFTDRLVLFAKQHPYLAVGLLGAALLSGPRRLFRLGTVVLPMALKLRKFMR